MFVNYKSAFVCQDHILPPHKLSVSACLFHAFCGNSKSLCASLRGCASFCLYRCYKRQGSNVFITVFLVLFCSFVCLSAECKQILSIIKSVSVQYLAELRVTFFVVFDMFKLLRRIQTLR